ncbi:hypothetical protein [Streptococcus halichoeri]|uniref:hypothetical protein n=1 Tax=Streptococcus halichoeri TaxID=254785 RepID=UPI00135C2877|nr:hypothetical protein [Streptococcus halichoeri]
MKLIKQFTKSKYLDESKGEDAIFVGKNFLAVIDGVSSKSKFEYNGMKTGRIASQLIKETLESIDIEPHSSNDIDIEFIISKINETFENFYKEVEFPYDIRSLGLQAVMAIYLKSNKKVYIIGDCQTRINDNIYAPSKLSDDILSQFRAFIHAVLEEKKEPTFKNGQEVARELILPWILDGTLFMNKVGKYGYSVINGEPIPKELILEITIKEGDTVTLATDGYPFLKENFYETEKYLSEIIKNDPQLINLFLSTKGVESDNVSYDDRSYIQFIA